MTDEPKHVPCGACGADQPLAVGTSIVSDRARSVTPGWDKLRVVRCRLCGFYYVDPMPFWSDDALQCLYGDEYFGVETQWWHHQRTEVDPRRRLDAIDRYRGGLVEGFAPRMLEIGCGRGYVLEHALSRGWQVWGLEPSQFWVERASARTGVRIWAQRVEVADLPAQSCDIVYSDSVIEHLADPMAMMKLVRRVLKPGGVAYLVTPNADALVNRFRELLLRLARSHRAPHIEPLRTPYHLIGFTPHSLAVLAERAGFRVRRMWVQHGAEEWRKDKGLTIANLKSVALTPALLAGELLGWGTTIEVVLGRE